MMNRDNKSEVFLMLLDDEVGAEYRFRFHLHH